MSKAMDFKQAQKRVEELVLELNQYSHEYYVLDAPTILMRNMINSTVNL